MKTMASKPNGPERGENCRKRDQCRDWSQNLEPYRGNREGETNLRYIWRNWETVSKSKSGIWRKDRNGFFIFCTVIDVLSLRWLRFQDWVIGWWSGYDIRRRRTTRGRSWFCFGWIEFGLLSGHIKKQLWFHSWGVKTKGERGLKVLHRSMERLGQWGVLLPPNFPQRGRSQHFLGWREGCDGHHRVWAVPESEVRVCLRLGRRVYITFKVSTWDHSSKEVRGSVKIQQLRRIYV